MLIDVAALVAAYHDRIPDPSNPAQRVVFGTSGHRGSSLETTFNEGHVLAISQAICQYRAAHGVKGPLFLGLDTHALSRPAVESALEVLAANHVEVRVASRGEYTPTPAISHAILTHNRGRVTGLADGIVVSRRTTHPIASRRPPPRTRSADSPRCHPPMSTSTSSAASASSACSIAHPATRPQGLRRELSRRGASAGPPR